MLLSQKAAEAEQEITRLRLGAMKVMSDAVMTENLFHFDLIFLCVLCSVVLFLISDSKYVSRLCIGLLLTQSPLEVSGIS
jgi:hypothetical protein